MPRFQVETATVPGDKGPRSVVFLTVGGYRFVLDAPNDFRAMDIALVVARALGATVEVDVDG